MGKVGPLRLNPLGMVISNNPFDHIPKNFSSISKILAELYIIVLIGWLDHYRS